MKTWTITEARANIAGLFDAARERGPQRIARRDNEAVVILAESDWNRFAAEYPDIADLVLKAPFDAGDLPPRRPARALIDES